MEQYKICHSPGMLTLGDCYCCICERLILGEEDCFSIFERNFGSIAYVCSEQCATFFIFQGSKQ